MAKPSTDAERDASPARVRLPRFLSEEDVGLGDVVTRFTTSIGIRPCGGCAQRAAAMNRWIALSGRKR